MRPSVPVACHQYGGGRSVVRATAFGTRARAGNLVGRCPPTRAGAAIDMGVRGFDLGHRGGRSEPTLPERRKRAGTPITANQDDNRLALAA